MKYKLKDKARWDAIKLAFPSFEERFQRGCEKQWDDETSIISIQDRHRYMVSITKDDIEAYDDYDPSKWNHYPEVTPPEGVWMQAEIVRVNPGMDRYVWRCAAQFKCGEWLESGMDKIFLGIDDEVRFRPWGDPR